MGLRPEPVPSVAVAAGSASGIEAALWHWAESMASRSGLTPSAAHKIASWHGPRAMCVIRTAMMDIEARQPLCPHTEHIVAEAMDAFRYEHAVTLGDVLLRRVPVALSGCWSPDCSIAAATAIGNAMGWSAEEVEWQLETFENERNVFLYKPGRNIIDDTLSPNRAA
jgi:glycerol-3-phosphate dehydrogenase